MYYWDVQPTLLFTRSNATLRCAVASVSEKSNGVMHFLSKESVAEDITEGRLAVSISPAAHTHFTLAFLS
eukprot:gene1838-1118_t